MKLFLLRMIEKNKENKLTVPRTDFFNVFNYCETISYTKIKSGAKICKEVVSKV